MSDLKPLTQHGFLQLPVTRELADTSVDVAILGVPYDLTHTCYTGRRPACGECDACAERVAAFRACGAVDPLEYEIDIDWASAPEAGANRE